MKKHLYKKIQRMVVNIMTNPQNKLWLSSSLEFDWVDYCNKIKEELPRIVELVQGIILASTEECKQNLKAQLTDIIETIYVFEPMHQYPTNTKCTMIRDSLAPLNVNLPSEVEYGLITTIADCDCDRLDEFVNNL